MRRFAIIAVCCLTVIFTGVDRGDARRPGGELGFIRQPVSTRPQIVKPNDYITVDLDIAIHDKCSCTLRVYLEKPTGERIMLPGVTRDRLPAKVPVKGGTDADIRAYRYKALIPQDTESGLYGLYVAKGTRDDLSRRAVEVVAEFPESYNILYISDPQVGRELDANTTKKYTLLLDRTLSDIAKIDPAVVIITGNITSGSRPDEIKRFLDFIDKINVPTFVAPGLGDAANDNLEACFGPANYSFMLGGHLFVSLDTQSEHILDADDETGRINWLEGVLGEHGDAPLKILFTQRYEDTPEALVDALKPRRIDLLLTGNDSSKDVRQAGAPPVVFVDTPAYADGFYRIIRIVDNKYSDETLVIPSRQSKYFISNDNAPAVPEK